MTNAEQAALKRIIERWRKEANDLSQLNRFGRYPDQSARVRQHMVLSTLRRCASALQRQLKKESHAQPE